MKYVGYAFLIMFWAWIISAALMPLWFDPKAKRRG